jgi:hypothetical protein
MSPNLATPVAPPHPGNGESPERHDPYSCDADVSPSNVTLGDVQRLQVLVAVGVPAVLAIRCGVGIVDIASSRGEEIREIGYLTVVSKICFFHCAW